MGLALDALREELTTPGGRGSPAVPARVTARRLAWIARVVAATPVALWCLGRITSAAFNTTLERTGPFAWEPAQAYVVWGARSVVAPCVYAALAIAFFVDGAVRRAAAVVVGTGGGRARAGPSAASGRSPAKLSLDDPRRAGAGSRDHRRRDALPDHVAVQDADSGVGQHHQHRGARAAVAARPGERRREGALSSGPDRPVPGVHRGTCSASCTCAGARHTRRDRRARRGRRHRRRVPAAERSAVPHPLQEPGDAGRLQRHALLCHRRGSAALAAVLS